MCTIIQVYSGPQNGLFSACLTISSDKYVWNINILILDRTRDLLTLVNYLHLKIVAFLALISFILDYFLIQFALI